MMLEFESFHSSKNFKLQKKCSLSKSLNESVASKNLGLTSAF